VNKKIKRETGTTLTHPHIMEAARKRKKSEGAGEWRETEVELRVSYYLTGGLKKGKKGGAVQQLQWGQCSNIKKKTTHREVEEERGEDKMDYKQGRNNQKNNQKKAKKE